VLLEGFGLTLKDVRAKVVAVVGEGERMLATRRSVRRYG